MKQGQASDRAGRQANRRNQVLCIPKHVSLRPADKGFIGFSSQCANAAPSNAATRGISAVLGTIQQIQAPAWMVLKCASNRVRPQAGVRGTALSHSDLGLRPAEGIAALRDDRRGASPQRCG